MLTAQNPKLKTSSRSRSFKDLVVWQRSMELAKEVYRVTKKFPKNEEFALASQLRRAAVSIPSNIAEGSKRGSEKDFLQFLRIANGSSAELETQLLIAREAYGFIDYSRCFGFLDEVQRMLNTFTFRLKTNNLKLKTVL